MARRTTRKRKRKGGVLARVRKPVPRPTRVAEDERKYSRARERDRLRKEAEENPNGGAR